MTCLFEKTYRLEGNTQTGNSESEPTRFEHHEDKKEEGTKVKKFGFATIIAGGLATAVLGFAAPAQAIAPTIVSDVAITAPSQGIDHLDWLNDIQKKANVARPDTTVRSNP